LVLPALKATLQAFKSAKGSKSCSQSPVAEFRSTTVLLSAMELISTC